MPADAGRAVSHSSSQGVGTRAVWSGHEVPWDGRRALGAARRKQLSTIVHSAEDAVAFQSTV
mgnify:CR=1 FL=1